jgi:hypothetical protein
MKGNVMSNKCLNRWYYLRDRWTVSEDRDVKWCKRDGTFDDLEKARTALKEKP